MDNGSVDDLNGHPFHTQAPDDIAEATRLLNNIENDDSEDDGGRGMFSTGATPGRSVQTDTVVRRTDLTSAAEERFAANRKTLMRELGIDTTQNFISFVQGPTFKPFWKELYTEHIYPAQIQARVERKARPRGPALRDIQNALMKGQRGGQMKYENPHTDKSDWEADDHLARFLWQTRHYNMDHIDGVFYGKNFSEEKIDALIWALYKYVSQEHTPSRINRPVSGGAAIFPDVIAYAKEEYGKRNPDHESSEAEPESTAEPEQVLTTRNPLAKRKKRVRIAAGASPTSSNTPASSTSTPTPPASKRLRERAPTPFMEASTPPAAIQSSSSERTTSAVPADTTTGTTLQTRIAITRTDPVGTPCPVRTSRKPSINSSSPRVANPDVLRSSSSSRGRGVQQLSSSPRVATPGVLRSSSSSRGRGANPSPQVHHSSSPLNVARTPGVQELSSSPPVPRTPGSHPQNASSSPNQAQDEPTTPAAQVAAVSQPYWKTETVTPLRRVRLVQQSEAPNLTDPYWQVIIAHRAIRGATFKPSEEDDFSDSEASETDSNAEQEEETPEITDDSYYYLDAETFDWRKELEAGLEKFSIVPSEHSVELYNEQQQYFDNLKYQRDNHEQACQALGIPNTETPKLPEMRQSIILKFWQPVAANAIMDFQKNPHLRGCILADVVGLGKTWITISYLLARAREWTNSSAETRDSAKPTLIVVPPSLVYQWADEIKRVTNKLRVVLYYGDSKATSQNAGFRVIEGKLTPSSKYFDGHPKRAWTVIITSYQSLSIRHGPTEQKSWRISSGWTAASAKARLAEQDYSWPLSLKHVFGLVVLDEAHLARNEDAFLSITIRWLEADFHLCLSATPLFNSYLDFQGFIPLLMHPHSNLLWSQESLERWNVTEDVNPFELDIEHPAAVLRLTERAMEMFVFNKEVSKTTAGARIGQVWEMCLIRRTLMSRLPFVTGPTIGADIPPTQSCVVTAEFTRPELKLYRTVTEGLYKKLVTKLRDGRLIWNMAKYRQLALLTTWIGFRYVHASVQAKDMPYVVRLAYRKELIMQWLNVIAARNPESAEAFPEGTDPNDVEVRQRQITLVLRESPRMRALLPRMIDQVIFQREKCIIWTLFPAQQAFVAAVLHLIGIDARIFHAHLNSLERAELVRTFNESRTEAMVLVCSYSVNSAGLNLQHLCRNVHLFETALSEAIMMQAIGRVRRIGQQRIVKIYDYRVPKSFNERQVSKTLEKALPGLIAELNDKLFDFTHTDSFELIMNNWAINDEGDIIRINPDDELPEGYSFVEADKVIAHIVNAMKGGKPATTGVLN